MANLKDLIVNGSARILGTLYANLSGNATTATTLQTGRNIQTNLASTSAASFNGSANVTPGVTGTLPVGNGGTGQTSVANIQAGKDASGNTITSTYATKTELNGKQATLVSGTNIKTVNSTSLLGSGNVAVQPTLVSGTNIKTINNSSILGSGNLTISASVATDNSTITKNGSDQIQTVAVKDNRSGNAIKTWVGTKAQYNAITTKDANTLYNITDDADTSFSLLNLLYPVGAIYIGTCNTCPLQTIGIGTWQLVSAGRVLQGVNTGQTVGDTVAAGLPNITGKTGDFVRYGTIANEGALYRTADTSENASFSSSSNLVHSGIVFDASRSSSIYGNSTTVQPPAYIVNIWERVS